MNKIIFFLLILTTLPVYSQERLPETVLCSPVFFETDINKGSGVFVADSNNVFFVSARHNLFTTDFVFRPRYGKFIFYPHNIVTDEQAVIEINLENAYNQNFISYDKDHDIAVILIGKVKKNDSSTMIAYYDFIKKNKSTFINIIFEQYIENYSKTSIGSDIFLFGYPSSIGLQKNPQFDYNRPLLRKGIIAGKYENNKSIIIDSPTYFGNSGGPVFIEKSSGEIFLIGIVSEYVPYIDRWENKKSGLENIQITNTGYSIVTSIEYALNLMKDY